ncbi:MAG: S8 family peptidase [Cytophagales bacterium]
MKFIALILSLSIFYFEVEAQDNNSFYYYKGKKVSLVFSDKKFYVQDASLATAIDSNKFSLKPKGRGLIVSSKRKSLSDCKLEINRLKKEKKACEIRTIIDNGKEIPLSDVFYVRLKSEKDTTELKKLVLENNCTNMKKVELMPLWFSLKIDVNSKFNALEMANLFYETGLFAKVDPGFMLEFKPACSSEPKFNEQWSLNTTESGQHDINLCEAWTITKGSPSVLVAVNDSGIDTTAEEFNGRLYHKSFCSQYSFNYAYNTDWSDHGTNVASVIAANENNSLMVGVAPNVKLMNISHSLAFIENATVHHAKAISWAWRNGAQIINNSWGDAGSSEYESLKSEILEDAIDSALVHGRNGLGTILVFSAGNYNKNFVEYPGSYNSGILVVGASNRQGQRTLFPSEGFGSSYGTALDLVAPGLGISVVSKGNVYNNTTNGTSFAAPHVSGVVALILSIAPNLTREEVVYIIEKTAQKTGGYNYQPNVGHPNGTWNQEVGHGLLDAYAALQLANCNSTLFINNRTYTGASNVVKACKVEFNNSKVTNGSKLNVLIGKEAILNGGFEVQLGAELEIK